MVNSILIAFGTRYGSTKEIAELIANEYKKSGIQVELVDLKKTPKKMRPSPSMFDISIVGSSILMGRWTTSVKKFIKKNSEYYAENPNKLAFFAVCAEAIDEEHAKSAAEKYIQIPFEKLGLKLNRSAAFGGIIDLTSSSKMPAIFRKMFIMGSKDQGGPNYQPGMIYDLRNLEKIKEFAMNFI